MEDEREIRDMLAELYDPAEIEVWLASPHPRLEGRPAATVIAEGNGETVKLIIRQLLDDVYI